MSFIKGTFAADHCDQPHHRLPPRHARAAARESALPQRLLLPTSAPRVRSVEGTVARGELHEDTYFYTGKIGNNPGDAMPFPVTKEVLERGRERFNIFCAPCHSRLGDGNGFVPSRGFSRKPPSFHIARLQKAPLGYFFDVITEGFGIMPDYASQIPPQDRWDIVAYIRALQLSQNATMADVPQGQKIPSEPLKFREAGLGSDSCPLLRRNQFSITRRQK